MESANTLSDSVNVLQNDIKDITTYIAINADVIKLLHMSEEDAQNVDGRIWQNEAPINLVQDMIALKGSIKTIAIYPENGLRPFLRGMDGSVYLSDIDKVRESEVYQRTLESDNGMLWMDVGTGVGSVYEYSVQEKVVLCREIYDMAKNERLAYIVVGVEQSYFEQLCSNVLTSDGQSVLLVDPNGAELAEVGEINEELKEWLLSEGMQTDDVTMKNVYFTKDGYDVALPVTKKDQTLVCRIAPHYGLGSLAAEQIYTPLFLLLAMLVGLLPLLLIMSRMVTHPLAALSDAIRKFSEGDFSQQVPVTTGDEIGEVTKCFNKMVTDISELIDRNYVITLKEKESELAALQSQINPHFLYNTLDSLYWQAMEADNEEIAENILALSQLFRLVLSQGKSEVTVEQEVELVGTYLQIQKSRFSRNLFYSIEVDEKAMRYHMPKLLLQPFVENAVVHGFERTEQPCHLFVRGYLTAVETEGGGTVQRLHFEVADTGIGMTQEQIKEVLEGSAAEPTEYRRQRIGRYAIKNIRERLTLKYRGDYTLEIRSRIGEGTVVILEFPAE